MFLPPKKKTIVAPLGGWKENTLYLVTVAWNRENPVHEAYLKTGFVAKDGSFGGYCCVWNNDYDGEEEACDAHYLKPIKELHTEKEGV